MPCPPQPCPPPVHQQQFNYYQQPQHQPAINIHNNIQPPMMCPPQPPVVVNIQPPMMMPPRPPVFGGIPFAGQFQGQLGGLPFGGGIPFGGQFNGQLGGLGFPSQNMGGALSDFTQQGNNFNLPPMPPPPLPPKKKSILPWVLGGGALALLLLAGKKKTDPVKDEPGKTEGHKTGE